MSKTTWVLKLVYQCGVVFSVEMKMLTQHQLTLIEGENGQVEQQWSSLKRGFGWKIT